VMCVPSRFTQLFSIVTDVLLVSCILARRRRRISGSAVLLRSCEIHVCRRGKLNERYLKFAIHVFSEFFFRRVAVGR
jgi:hypothetical protein